MLGYTIRLVNFVAANASGPRVTGGDTLTQSFRAWPWHCDTNLHINNGRYLQFMDYGRVVWLTRAGALEATFKPSVVFLAAGVTITFRREIRVGTSFILETRLAGYDERWFFFEQSFRTSDGKPAARALVRLAARAKGEPVCISTLVEGLAPEPPPLSSELRAWDESVNEGMRYLRAV